MLTEEEIEKLIEPIVQRQSNLSSAIIYTIAKRIKAIGDIDPDSLYTIEQSLKNAKDINDINRLITDVMFLQVMDLAVVFNIVAKSVYESSKESYLARGKAFIDFEEHAQMRMIAESALQETNDKIRDMYKTQSYVINDEPKNPTEAYKQITSTALSTVSLKDNNSYLAYTRNTLTQLNNSGLRVVNEDNTQRFDLAIRNVALNGVRDVCKLIQEQVGLEIEADGVELSVHEYPAPDHAPIQGHQFTKVEYDKLQNGESFEDVNGEKFEAIERPIGAWNCRHFVYHIVVGSTEPSLNKKGLQAILDRNERGYTTKKGKHLTLYECTQMQRYYEREMRKSKEGLNMSKLAGDSQLYAKYEARYNRLLHEYYIFSHDCGLKVHPERLQVLGI